MQDSGAICRPCMRQSLEVCRHILPLPCTIGRTHETWPTGGLDPSRDDLWEAHSIMYRECTVSKQIASTILVSLLV